MNVFFTSLLAKAVSRISRLFLRGAGVTWAGEISLKINPQILTKLTRGVKKGVILVAGTNGKTTTSAMIAHVLKQKGFRVISNKTGANLKNGLVGSLVLETNFLGQVNTDWAIFEVDEATLPLIVGQVKPKIILLLNLFRDQLDRYGEVDTIAQKWLSVLEDYKTTLVVNADDPLIGYIGENYPGHKYYFGLTSKKYSLDQLSHASDSTYCLKCGGKLKYKMVFLSHFGDWYCPKCGLKRVKPDLSSAQSPLSGIYNLYNSLAALLACHVLGINYQEASFALDSFKPAFGRQEEFEVKKKRVKLFLSKNPAGFNESIRTVLEKRDLKGTVFVLNDRIPDGTDVSWIWDVDFEKIGNQTEFIICSGDRSFDMGLRLKYALEKKDRKKILIEKDLEKALYLALDKTAVESSLYIFPTYSAMLETREVLLGKKIL